jgi:hypothetical protein
MLVELRSRLTRTEAAYRDEAFRKAHRFVDVAAGIGGVHVVNRAIMKTYPLPARKDHRRVDIVVNRGSAFTPDT